MPTYSFPPSVRKYIRLQKSLIRRGVLDMAEQSRLISKLYADMIQRYHARGVKAEASVLSVISPKRQEPVSSKPQ